MKNRRTVFRMATNFLSMIPYLFVLAKPEDASYLLLIPMLVWGGWAFREFSRAFDLGTTKVTVSFSEFGWIWLLGSMFFAIFGVVVIPFLLIGDAIRLYHSP